MPAKSRTGRKFKRPFKRLPKGEHGGVQLLLIHNVEHLGKQGDIVEVKQGYAMSYRELADELGKQSITIEANANDEGHLYGSVGPHEIVDALKEAEFSLAQDQIRLEGPLKELGLYTVKVHLHSEVEANVKVWVVPTAVAEEAEPGKS